MKFKLRNAVAFLALLAVVIGVIPPISVTAASNTSAVGQVLDSYAPNSSAFTLSDTSRIFVIADMEPTGELLQTVQLIQRQFAADGRPAATPMVIAWGPESWIADDDIVVCVNPTSGIPAEGYELTVTTTARIEASDVDGLLYGANMLLKHLRYADSNSIQGFTAADAPDTVQRAVSLDCGRKYYTKDWICNFIREMSWMGYNTLQFHFSDDSGFRFDLWDPAYYTGQFQPKNDFSWICGSNYTSWTLSAYKNDADKGKYLTTAEVIEILRTAKEYHIEIIPCFDSPSHLDYLTWTYEQNYDSNHDYSFYSTYDQKTYYAADVNGIINYTNSKDWSTDLKWPYYSAVNVKGDQAKAFIFELYIDIANFFKEYAGSTDISVGADEVQLSTSNLASGYSYAWGFPEFVSYINELNTLLNSMDYTMRMYNDFMGSKAYSASDYTFADNIEIQYWDSPFNPSYSTASNHTEPVSYYVDQGRILYNCIQTNTYYALRKTSSGSDARSVYNRQWTFYHANEEDIWNEWYSADISEHGDYSEDAPDVPQANLGGAYFLIWCDYACVSTEREIWNGCYDTSGSGEYYSLRDRMWSNITKMWNWDVNETLSFEDFAIIRDAYGDLPGIGSSTTACSEPTVLPTATEPISGYAGGCAEYAAYCSVEITRETDVMTLPCDTVVEATSTVMEVAHTGDGYTAIRLYENTAGELWYKVRTQTGLVGYIKAADTVYVTDAVDDITVTGTSVPSGHVVGNIFYVKGEITAHYNTLTSVAVYVHEGFGRSGEVVTGASDTVTDNYYSLLSSTIDNKTSFGKVGAGKNTYVIYADYQSNHASGNTVVSGTGRVYLVEKCFYALNSSVNQSTCTHSYSETLLYASTCTEPGTTVYGCEICGHVYEEQTALLGHDYRTETIPATCVEFEKLRHTCTVCGYSYVEYPEGIMTDWQESKPEGVDESLIEIKELYRYRDYETTTSFETTLPGYTPIGSAWKQSSAGSVQYVNSWPSGFLTSNSLYAQYDNKNNKVAAFETETTKRVVDGDKVTGYLYYHWCYNGSYYSYAYKTGNYTVFHAYYSTTAPGNYTCDTSDMSYKTSHTATCTNSNWYFVANVYTQSYTDYQKLYTYERWTDWSDWSETPVTASSTRKVEKQTMYRYVDGTYAAHTWEDGVCSICGGSCAHTYQNNVCTVCGTAKPVKDLHLFGYINGADYACEEDADNPGEYVFRDNTLTVFFTQDSYVGIKTADNSGWYMTDGWQGFVSSATLYNTAGLSDADKLFVPGGTEVTFTLTDNGDDTYVLSYVAVECSHESHSTDGICQLCGDVVEHSYDTSGFCSCGLECVHTMTGGVCSNCGKECDHIYQNNVCTLCGSEKPQFDYYLFGYINGANYACEEDYANLGIYRFVDGKLVVRFTSDSYVAVKASDNLHWYMTEGWQGQVTSVTLYNTKTLAKADKLYVPGGKEVTFTLLDNGDDTYVLSYEATCSHVSHDQSGICSDCGETVRHTYQSNKCAVCGYQKPVYDYYLFGYINGADYADRDDSANLGIYRFENGSLVVFFTQDSYVGVKTSDNLNRYMTDGYQAGATSVTLVNADTIVTEDKLFVPGNMKVTFTLTDNGDDTYILSYEAVACPHDSHDPNGNCTLCGETVDHRYVNGFCSCGLACHHSYLDGICSLCGLKCQHNWLMGRCQSCGMLCDHEWANGVCGVCAMTCVHTWQEGVCTVCHSVCEHSWRDGYCIVCESICTHTYQHNVCTNCGFQKPKVDYYLCGVINGTDCAWGENIAESGSYLFIDGKLIVTFRQDSYVGLKASDNKNWYMTDGDLGQSTSVTLHNTNLLDNPGQMFVPGGMKITFTLVDNGDDTLTLSYVAVECPHESHDISGQCVKCGAMVGHDYSGEVTAPTCTADGCTTYTCPCGDSYQEVIPALGHSAVTDAAVDSTCTETGLTAGSKCSVCGEVLVAQTEIPSLGHKYENGSCTVCGAADPDYNPVVVPSFSVLSKTLNLEGEVKYNMIFMASNTNSVTEMGLITFLSNPSDVSIENADYVIPGAVSTSGMYMVGSQGIPAKNLGDTLYMVIYAELTDGSYAYSGVVPYSAKEYAYAQLNNNGITENQRKLLVAMLNYGAEAQLAFGYNTDNLINAGLDTMEIPEMVNYSSSLLDACVTASTSKTGNFPAGGFHMNSATVSLEGALAINYLLMPANTPANGMKVYYWTAETYNSVDALTVENADGTLDSIVSSGMYMATYNGLAASQMGDTVYVAAVYENGGNTYTTGVISYSLAKYLTATADGTGTQKNLATATVIYGYYANIEFPNV